jgi:hypothetical protein
VESWKIALSLTELGQKAASQKNTAIKDVTLQKGIVDVGVDDVD